MPMLAGILGVPAGSTRRQRLIALRMQPSFPFPPAGEDPPGCVPEERGRVRAGTRASRRHAASASSGRSPPAMPSFLSQPNRDRPISIRIVEIGRSSLVYTRAMKCCRRTAFPPAQGKPSDEIVRRMAHPGQLGRVQFALLPGVMASSYSSMTTLSNFSKRGRMDYQACFFPSFPWQGTVMTKVRPAPRKTDSRHG